MIFFREIIKYILLNIVYPASKYTGITPPVCDEFAALADKGYTIAVYSIALEFVSATTAHGGVEYLGYAGIRRQGVELGEEIGAGFGW